MFSTAAIIIVLLCVVGYMLARQRVTRLASQSRDFRSLHSLPSYHGAFVALWTGIPSLFLVLLWLLIQGDALNQLILAALPERLTGGIDSAQASLLVSQVRQVAGGRIFGDPDPAVIAVAQDLNTWQAIARWSMVACGSALALAALFITSKRISPEFRARHRVERILSVTMVVCATAAILTTLGILLSLLFESFRFFDRVPVSEFLFGLNWEPQIPIREGQVAGAGAFGAIPVFLGTLLIAVIAMTVAMPVGIFSSIYLAEYAGPRTRAMIKPLLEILAGIPTLVYGFFAVLVVAPALRQFGLMLGIDVSPNSALAAGGVMGIMIIPFISSISDDALAAVPRAMRDGSYALGATKSETILKVLLPAALPGIVGGNLLAVSRAIGETMIVVMAAGLIATMTLNPLDSVTTVTVQIVTLLIGDTEFDNPKTLAAFALGLVLFLSTLALNITALSIVKKYREQYE